MSEKVFFGNKKIDPSIKQSFVNDVFSSVASNYDVMNDLMSFGTHRLWKDKFVNEITDFNKKIIDVAGGTGDITARILKKAKKLYLQPDITIFDINSDMLKKGKEKFYDQGLFTSKLNWICGNAESMPFKDNVFDFYVCAFGYRNMTNINLALHEARRVLKPGGKFICLEFSKVYNPLLNKFYQFYSKNIIAKLGGIVANDFDSYLYLVESIDNFLPQEEFTTQVSEAGFNNTSFESLFSGVCTIYRGYK